MVFRSEDNRKKIKEFLDLIDNNKIELRHYKNPVLVWGNDDGICHYSLWEAEILDRFGLENVEGWDYKEDLLFCPDWIAGEDEDDLDDDIDDDEDLGKFIPLVRK